MKTACPAISVDPEVHSGDPVFSGTRVPVKTLFEHLGSGHNVDVFIECFPSVTREQVEEVLSFAAEKVLGNLAHAA